VGGWDKVQRGGEKQQQERLARDRVGSSQRWVYARCTRQHAAHPRDPRFCTITEDHGGCGRLLDGHCARPVVVGAEPRGGEKGLRGGAARAQGGKSRCKRRCWERGKKAARAACAYGGKARAKRKRGKQPKANGAGTDVRSRWPETLSERGASAPSATWREAFGGKRLLWGHKEGATRGTSGGGSAPRNSGPQRPEQTTPSGSCERGAPLACVSGDICSPLTKAWPETSNEREHTGRLQAPTGTGHSHRGGLVNQWRDGWGGAQCWLCSTGRATKARRRSAGHGELGIVAWARVAGSRSCEGRVCRNAPSSHAGEKARSWRKGVHLSGL